MNGEQLGQLAGGQLRLLAQGHPQQQQSTAADAAVHPVRQIAGVDLVALQGLPQTLEGTEGVAMSGVGSVFTVVPPVALTTSPILSEIVLVTGAGTSANASRVGG